MPGDKRKQILTAALTLFSERGYNATTIPVISEYAEVGIGTIYRYFKNKEALLNDLFQESIQNFQEAVGAEQSVCDEKTVYEEFQELFQGLLFFSRRNITAIYFIDAHKNSPLLTQVSRDAYQELLAIFEVFLKKGQKQGLIKKLPIYGQIVLLYGAFTSFYSYIQQGKLEETDELLNGLRQSCWDAIALQQTE
ncbi:TetR family transcriptional regulator [Bacillus lacus]|uniref:TetR family transcriptional regulator n=1 Tax=Metabacillus lacus TaxID=1983721 RepID=A0A7X2IW37_9BACI|nr:TetR/AcrR family transcriptional regulator [Metabacillus lacus]MRX70769.1 TetR family transcriptional regulator [Metabacillus lacus]